jgi:phenylpyruvate tautomerase PptA (4-oxalocrotonate tautomerase family)
MPLVKIEIIKGNSKEYKKALLNAVHDSLVESFKIPDYDRFQRLYELDKENFEIPSNKSSQAVLIEITVFPGRSLEAKKSLYQNIVNKLAENPGIDGNDIVIVINEPPMENWALRGGKPASEVNIGFKIDV